MFYDFSPLVRTGVVSVQLGTDLQIKSQHQLLDRNASGEECLPSFACATWSPQASASALSLCTNILNAEGGCGILRKVWQKPHTLQILQR